MKKRFVVLGLLLLCLGGKAQDAYVPSPENLEARKEFQDSKFGIFLHWGLYSMLAQGEWVMTNQNLDHMEYRKLASAFYPSRFDAAEWVAAIKAAGAKYICFTTRHHEGFSMFDSRFTDYNIVKATPFGRDVLKELAEEWDKIASLLFSSGLGPGRLLSVGADRTWYGTYDPWRMENVLSVYERSDY